MSELADLLASRASLVLAALTVTWVAIVLLALVAANLHFRLAHLETKNASVEESRTPFGHLLGEPLGELLGLPGETGARLALVLSSECESCDRILAELGSGPGDLPVALLWRDGEPPPEATLPAAATVVPDGPEVSRRLGVRVTPFALSADRAGRVVQARPVGSLAAWADLKEAATTTPAASTESAVALSHPTLKGVPS